MFQISLDDSYTKWICSACLEQLNIAYDLKRKCENSDAHLRTYIEHSDSIVNQR